MTPGQRTLAQRERQALVATMAAAGPDAPTLCGTWLARDLAAHLVVRERRPDAAPGIMAPALAGYLEAVQTAYARRPFQQLLELVRTGPPWWSPLRPVDALVNSVEFFVHHEDVRRGAPGWEPRVLPVADERQLWNMLRRTASFGYRKAPVRVALVTPDGSELRVGAKSGATVTLRAPASELTLYSTGRGEVRVEITGDPAAVEALARFDRSV
ncbi:MULTISPECIES: TIGR03085 family metal-binding protein [unclassified Nocardia]|uniref:TIGR03085 family metal-binding protein n=1 Tax=unclassified Nocardia TaxID=2637762 RepID=UPI001CE4283D|nr:MULTISPECIES: TIGR03085 family metal-binding protein [unclassified Nocardia]